MALVVAAWKQSAARRAKVIWQRGFFDHRLRNDAQYVAKADYIKHNPVRKGLISNPDQWTYLWPSRAMLNTDARDMMDMD